MSKNAAEILAKAENAAEILAKAVIADLEDQVSKLKHQLRDREPRPAVDSNESTPKNRPPRDPETRADRVVEALMRDPHLAVLVRRRLVSKQYAHPWERNDKGSATLWTRSSEEGVVVFLRNDTAGNWLPKAKNPSGDWTTFDETNDLEAGKFALDMLLLNTGWVLL